MPLFGKKDKKMDLPEVVDFSNDTWSFKGVPPVYQIQSDGFSYDIVDADSNDKNAISLGIAGMLVIVLNAKGPKIKEDELLPQFGKVIKTRNWHSMTVKEANFLVQTAIKKLTNSATSGDVFDLASYAPLEVKRVLLKTLFTISRMQLPPEFREEAEHRVIDDIVPDIFANPEYELALLTGLIVKTDEKAAESVSSHIETAPIIDTELPFSQSSAVDVPSQGAAETPVSDNEPDSAFAELQKIYGRRVDSPQVRAAAAQNAAQENQVTPEIQGNNGQPVSQTSMPAPVSGNVPEPNNPFTSGEPVSVNPAAPNFSVPQPNNPFSSANIPQPAAPNFSAPQPNNPFAANQGQMPYPQQQRIPQPPFPGNMQPGNFPYGQNNQAMPNQPMPNQAFPQGNPYGGAPQQFQPYPPQMMQQNQGGANNPYITQNSPQAPFPPQSWQPNMQMNQNMPNYPQNQAPGMQNAEGNPQQPYPGWQNRQQNYPQPPMQNQQNNQ